MTSSERFNKKRVAYATPFHSRVRRSREGNGASPAGYLIRMRFFTLLTPLTPRARDSALSI